MCQSRPESPVGGSKSQVSGLGATAPRPLEELCRVLLGADQQDRIQRILEFSCATALPDGRATEFHWGPRSMRSVETLSGAIVERCEGSDSFV